MKKLKIRISDRTEKLEKNKNFRAEDGAKAFFEQGRDAKKFEMKEDPMEGEEEEDRQPSH